MITLLASLLTAGSWVLSERKSPSCLMDSTKQQIQGAKLWLNSVVLMPKFANSQTEGCTGFLKTVFEKWHKDFYTQQIKQNYLVLDDRLNDNNR